MRDPGTYALVIALGVELHLHVGKIGMHDLLPGHYVYVGSAMGGLSGRLKRHLRSEKNLHWHIDYLLQQAAVTKIWYMIGRDKLECRWNAILRNLPGAAPSIPGFGASDCLCYSHLTYFLMPPPFILFKQSAEQKSLSQVYELNEFSFHRLRLGEHA